MRKLSHSRKRNFRNRSKCNLRSVCLQEAGPSVRYKKITKENCNCSSRRGSLRISRTTWWVMAPAPRGSVSQSALGKITQVFITSKSNSSGSSIAELRRLPRHMKVLISRLHPETSSTGLATCSSSICQVRGTRQVYLTILRAIRCSSSWCQPETLKNDAPTGNQLRTSNNNSLKNLSLQEFHLTTI